MQDDKWFINWAKKNYPPNVAEYIIESLIEVRRNLNERATRKDTSRQQSV